MNYKLLIQYDGTDFHGWQIQTNRRTVQGDLTDVLQQITGEKVSVSGSGRTDAGVHAQAQIANVHLQKEFAPERLRGALNGNLRRDVRIMAVEIAPADFHARFSATGKTYLYRVLNAPVASPFWTRYALHERRVLDLEKMREAARLFLGVHDWTAFSAARSDVETRVREVTRIDIETRFDARADANFVEFTVSAKGFLRYMARSIVGTLLEVGRGAKEIEIVRQAIESGERRLAKETAPAHGLTLLKVSYD